MIRGGKIDAAILGAMQVSARRHRQLDDPRQDGQGHGRRDGPRPRRQAGDRADGARRQGRLVQDRQRVLAALHRPGVVQRIITDLAVIDVTPTGLVLRRARAGRHRRRGAREDRADRAGRARTSPDALDGVFGRVARHRRAVRALAGGGAALALVAGGLVANAATHGPARRTLVADGSPTTSPSLSTSPSVSVSPTPDESDDLNASNRAVVATRDHHLSVIDTTTGEEMHRIGTFEAKELAWSPDRKTLAVVQGCILMLWDVESSNPRGDLGNAHAPAFSPDGTMLASSPCGKATTVDVLDLAKGEVVKSYPAASPSPDLSNSFEANASVTSLVWRDDRTIAVASHYEGAIEVRLLDVRSDRTLGDTTALDAAADHLAGGSRLYGSLECCYPEWDKPTTVWELAGGKAVTRFDHPSSITSLAVDRRGAVLFVDEEGLWRWNGAGVPVLVDRNVVAVAA
jgi:hypothetical protein